MTREKAEKACELFHQIERLEGIIEEDESMLRSFLDENYIGNGKLILSPSQSLIVPNKLLKDYIRQYLDYSKKEFTKLKDQLDAL